MRISTKGRYSLEALLYMAVHSTESLSVKTIAGATGISDGYLEQLFIPLRKAGIIRGRRGPRGGYCLSREREKITAGDILRTMEGVLKPTDCVSADTQSEDCVKSKTCPLSASCATRKIWVKLYREINGCVDSITLADLAESYETMEQTECAL